MVEKKKPWGYRKDLQHIRWSPEELNKKLLNDIPNDERNLKFLFIMLYLAGGRLQEILSLNIEGEHRPSLRWKDIYYLRLEKGETEEEDKWALCIECRILKQDRHKEPPQKWKETRIVMIPLINTHYDFELLGFVDDYLKDIGWYSSPSYYDISDRKHNGSDKEFFAEMKSMSWIEQLCNKYLKCNCHYLRHLKFSHLSKYDELTPQMIQEIGKWKSGDMALKYSRTTEKDIIKRLWGEG